MSPTFFAVNFKFNDLLTIYDIIFPVFNCGRKIMKRSLVSLLAVFVLSATVLAGCDKGYDQNGVERSATEESVNLAEKKVGVCIYQFSDTFMSLYREELGKALVDSGFSKDNIMFFDGFNDPDLQISQVRRMIDEGVDVLIVNPVSSASAEAITDIAVEADVPLIYINREPAATDEARWEENEWNVTYIGCDARQSGMYQGEIISDLGMSIVDTNGDGVIQYMMIEGDPENIDSQFRTKYSVEMLSDAGFKMECVSDEIGYFHRDTANQIMGKALAEGSHLEVVFCNNDAMALGVMDALGNSDKKAGKDIFIVGVDGLEEALQRIIDGGLAGTVFNDYAQQAISTAEAAKKFVSGESNDHYIACRYIKVTAENADKILEEIKE